MLLKNTKERYGAVARLFHWLMALIIFGLLAAGLIMEELPNGPDKFRIIGLHKSFGITILILAILRLWWKAGNIAPLLPDTLNAIEKRLAHLGHAFLYILMLAMPLSGWMMSSAAGFSVSVFGWFTLPNLVSPNVELKRDFINIHETLAWVLMGMIALHIMAALLHHFYHKDGVLRRMLPFVR